MLIPRWSGRAALGAEGAGDRAARAAGALLRVPPPEAALWPWGPWLPAHLSRDRAGPLPGLSCPQWSGCPGPRAAEPGPSRCPLQGQFGGIRNRGAGGGGQQNPTRGGGGPGQGRSPPTSRVTCSFIQSFNNSSPTARCAPGPGLGTPAKPLDSHRSSQRCSGACLAASVSKGDPF